MSKRIGFKLSGADDLRCDNQSFKVVSSTVNSLVIEGRLDGCNLLLMQL